MHLQQQASCRHNHAKTDPLPLKRNLNSHINVTQTDRKLTTAWKETDDAVELLILSAQQNEGFVKEIAWLPSDYWINGFESCPLILKAWNKAKKKKKNQYIRLKPNHTHH